MTLIWFGGRAVIDNGFRLVVMGGVVIGRARWRGVTLVSCGLLVRCGWNICRAGQRGDGGVWRHATSALERCDVSVVWFVDEMSGWTVCRAGQRGDGGMWRHATLVATRRVVPCLLVV